MKRVIVRALAAIGLVPARRYHEVSRRANELARDRDDWKKRAAKLARRERTHEQQARGLERHLQKMERQLQKIKRHAGPIADDDLVVMQTRLAETELALTLARDQLNAIEVKLEILEGAANVLDARTRAQFIDSTADRAVRTSV